MKRLDRFILSSFIGPFFAILFVVIFILMMQFLWLYIDELVGKGLSFKVILEFLGWGSATLIPLSLPLATLLSAVMTLGTLGENNELLAIKAAGISLKRVLAPLIIVSAIISVAAFFASNDKLAVELIHELNLLGIPVPEEVKVAGLENLEYLYSTFPSLTTAAFDNVELVRAACALLQKMMNNPGKNPPSVRVPMSLITRESTVSAVYA